MMERRKNPLLSAQWLEVLCVQAGCLKEGCCEIKGFRGVGHAARCSPRLPAEKRLEQADPDRASFPLTFPPMPNLPSFLLSCPGAGPAAEAARASVYNYPLNGWRFCVFRMLERGMFRGVGHAA